MHQEIQDYFNFSFNGTFASAQNNILIVPVQLPFWVYVNNVSGTNTGANSYNAEVGYVDDAGNYIPFVLTACAQNAVFNTVIDKYIRPEFGIWVGVTASVYPVTTNFMIDGYLFSLE